MQHLFHIYNNFPKTNRIENFKVKVLEAVNYQQQLHSNFFFQELVICIHLKNQIRVGYLLLFPKLLYLAYEWELLCQFP